MRKLVSADDQNGAKDALDQASGGGNAPLAADDALEVDVGIEHLARRWADRVALQQDLLEADRQRQAEAQDEQQDDHAQNAGQGDVPQALPSSGAVHDGSFIERSLNVQ